MEKNKKNESIRKKIIVISRRQKWDTERPEEKKKIKRNVRSVWP
jgi:hypothetical protein